MTYFHFNIKLSYKYWITFTSASKFSHSWPAFIPTSELIYIALPPYQPENCHIHTDLLSSQRHSHTNNDLLSLITNITPWLIRVTSQKCQTGASFTNKSHSSPFPNRCQSKPGDTLICQWTVSSLVQVMACCLFGGKPLPEPMLTYCQLDLKEHILMKYYLKFESFQSRKCIWKCRLQMSAILFQPLCGTSAALPSNQLIAMSQNDCHISSIRSVITEDMWDNTRYIRTWISNHILNIV